MGRLSHGTIHLHYASEISLDGFERRLTGVPILTITQGVELLLRVGQRPDLLLTLRPEIPQVGRDDGNRRIWHQRPLTVTRRAEMRCQCHAPEATPAHRA